MSTVETCLAARSSSKTSVTVEVALTEHDAKLLRAFGAWQKEHTRSPKREEIEHGYEDHRLDQGRLWPTGRAIGPKVFARLVTLALIEHSRNGHCWLTAAGADALRRVLEDDDERARCTCNHHPDFCLEHAA